MKNKDRLSEEIIVDLEKIKLIQSNNVEVGSKGILKERAERLSRDLKKESVNQDKLEVLSFKLASEVYAIEVPYVNKVYLLKDLSPLPGVSPYIIGIINVRGHIVPVIDFKKIFDLSTHDKQNNESVIVVSIGDAIYGLLVNEVLGLESILLNEIQSDLPTLTGERLEFIKGVSNEQIVILDPLKIATHKSIVVNDKI